MFSGAFLVRWRLAPAITPVEVVRVGERRKVWGPCGPGPVFADREAVWLRDWDDLHRVRTVAAELLPDELPCRARGGSPCSTGTLDGLR
jgi:hypothetical protein